MQCLLKPKPSSLLLPKTLTLIPSSLVPISSFSSSFVSHSKISHSNHVEETSLVYQQALKFQRPTVIKCEKGLRNSANFIGTIGVPVQKSPSGKGVFTKIGVECSGKSNRMIWILLEMRAKLAEIALQHLQPLDLVYVSGHLTSSPKDDAQSLSQRSYKVLVNDLNFVKRDIQDEIYRKDMNLEPKIESKMPSGAKDQDKDRERLHLWQLFLADPSEWWDNRGCKKYRNGADFVHKNTREKLRIMPNDPPWVRSQLQRLDLQKAEFEINQRTNDSAFSDWNI
ncbi:hypothetical protein AMTRI_Chr13g124180 [Amborella trichopoda]